MKINKENYEVFLIDYLDGNLGEKEMSEVEQFLLMHPDIKKEFQGIEKMHLGDEKLDFPLKGKVQFRADGISETDYLCVGHIEGDLSEEENKQLSELRKNTPAIERELKLFSFTKLKPALQIIFSGKGDLKRGQRLVTPKFWAYSAAASIVAGMIALLMLFQDNTVDQYSANTVKRKKVARKVENSERKQPEGKTVKRMAPNTTDDKTVASVSEKSGKSNEPFVMEFEEVTMQMDEVQSLASVQVYQPEAMVEMTRMTLPAVNVTFSEEHELSQRLIDENKAYIDYWTKIYEQGFTQNEQH